MTEKPISNMKKLPEGCPRRLIRLFVMDRVPGHITTFRENEWCWVNEFGYFQCVKVTTEIVVVAQYKIVQ